jgi:elongator complex protein 4
MSFSNSSSSSFKRALHSTPSISPITLTTGGGQQGLRTSVSSSMPMVSTGLASLDDLLGGGLPLGSLLLIHQDRYSSYARLLSKFFLSQGLLSHHSLCLVSSLSSPSTDDSAWMTDPQSVFGFLGLSTSESLKEKESKENIQQQHQSEQQKNLYPQSRALGSLRSASADKMNIAWRYQSQPQFSSSLTRGSSLSPNYCTTFDLTKPVDPQKIQLAQSQNRIFFIDPSSSSSLSENSQNDMYRATLERIQSFLVQESKRSSEKRVIRLVIDGFASGSWDDPLSSGPHQMVLFFSFK